MILLVAIAIEKGLSSSDDSARVLFTLVEVLDIVFVVDFKLVPSLVLAESIELSFDFDRTIEVAAALAITFEEIAPLLFLYLLLSHVPLLLLDQFERFIFSVTLGEVCIGFGVGSGVNRSIASCC